MELESNKSLKNIIPYLPARIARALERAQIDGAAEEIRLRVARPPQIVTSNGDELIGGLVFSASEARELLESLCRHSVYAMEEELRRGFISLDGGVRVGVCGKPVIKNGSVERLTDVTCFNIRLCREAIGCAESVMPMLLDSGRIVSCLIAAPPGGGKTTLLRDVARCISDGVGVRPHKVGIADERGELCGCVGGAPTFSTGLRSDVMELCPKAAAIPMLVRTMSPEVIITDEIGDPGDAEAIAEASRCGVAVIASAHASSRKDLLASRRLSGVLEAGVFSRILLLKRSGSMLRVSPIVP